MSDDPSARVLAALARLEAGQDKPRTDLMARMDRLQDAVTAQRDADVVNFGAAERAGKIAVGAREEVRAMSDQLNAMIRQIQRLQSEVRTLKGDP